MAGAYGAQFRRERRHSKRTLMGGSWIDDTRLALRRITRRPAASIASVVTLACGIAAGAVTWSLLSSLLLHPLPVKEPERLMSVAIRYPALDEWRPARVSAGYLYPEYVAIRDSGTFDGLAAGGLVGLLVGQMGREVPQQRTVYFASHDFFDTLGARPVLGRDFTAAEDTRGAAPVAVLSDRFWRRAFNGDPGVIGATLSVGQTRATIVGVAPRGFRGLSLADAPDLYMPLNAIGAVGPTIPNPFFDPGLKDSPSAWIRIVGRLHRESTADQAVTGLNASSRAGRAGATSELTPINTAAIPEIARPNMTHFTRLLAATVGLLLLIGCLTVGMLLLVRTECRRDEFAICLAIGGTRASLARGVLMEGLLLSAAGVVLALPLASWLFTAIGTFTLPGGIDIGLLDLAIDRRVLLAAAIGAVAATLLISLIACLFGFSSDVGNVLRSRAGATPRVTRRLTRQGLVTAQVSVALVLLAGAGLFGRSLQAALTVNPGFDASRVFTSRIELRRHGYTNERASVFFHDLRTRLAQLPGAQSAAMIQREGGMTPAGRITVDGIARQFPTTVAYVAVDEHYFSTMGMKPIEGRDFSRHDTPASPLVVIVSQSFGRLLAGGSSPLGRRITETSGAPGKPDGVPQVIGVVPDVITDVSVTEPLVLYYSLRQREAVPLRTLVLRSDRETGVSRDVLAAIKQMDPLVEPEPILSIGERLERQMGPQRLGGFVLGALGTIAFLLTLLGAYVLAESMAAARMREFGIRAALGASRIRLGWAVLGETAWLVGIGLAAGLLLAWIGSGTIRTFLFRITPLDLVTLSSVASSILSLAILVSLRPAVLAARVDLTQLLRDE